MPRIWRLRITLLSISKKARFKKLEGTSDFPKKNLIRPTTSIEVENPSSRTLSNKILSSHNPMRSSNQCVILNKTRMNWRRTSVLIILSLKVTPTMSSFQVSSDPRSMLSFVFSTLIF